MKNKSFSIFILLGLILTLATQSPLQAQREKRKRLVEVELNDLRSREAESLFTEGMKYFILEDYTKALSAFQGVVALNPEEPMVHYKMAEIFAKSSNPEDLNRGSASIEKALKGNKKNPYFYLLAAEIYTSQSNFSKAEATLEALNKEINDQGESLYQLAAIYLYDRKPEEAIKTYNRAEALMGINDISSLQKQKIYLDLGKVDQAIAEGEKLLMAFPDEERFVIAFAEMLGQKGQQNKAMESLEKFLSFHPEAGTTKILLAGLYRDAGREKESRDLLKYAINDPSVDIRSKLIVMETYVSQIAGTKGAARKSPDLELGTFVLGLYQDLLNQYPEDPNVHIAGGNLHISLNQKEEAEKSYLAAIQRGSASFEAWQNLLALEAESNKFDSLIFHSEQGLEIFPNQAMLHYFNGYGHLRNHNYREAANSLERGKKLAGSNVNLVHDINGMLGEAYNGLKEYNKSDLAYDAALAQTPNDNFLLNNYSYYLAMRKEHLEKAERMAAQVIRDQPDNANYLDTYAWVLYAREKFKEARKTMEHALELPGASSVLYEHYGDILFRLGDIDGAVKQWEKARSLSSQHELIDKKIANRRLY